MTLRLTLGAGAGAATAEGLADEMVALADVVDGDDPEEPG
jgi:hypothetical protein